MTNARRLIPLNKPRCIGEVGEVTRKYNASRQRKEPTRCAMHASFEIDGKLLCGRHAAQYALHLLLESQPPFGEV